MGGLEEPCPLCQPRWVTLTVTNPFIHTLGHCVQRALGEAEKDKFLVGIETLGHTAQRPSLTMDVSRDPQGGASGIMGLVCRD